MRWLCILDMVKAEQTGAIAPVCRKMRALYAIPGRSRADVLQFVQDTIKTLREQR